MATLNIRLPESESEILRRYCCQEDRNRTDLLREFIRSLEAKLENSKSDDYIKLEDLDVSILPSLSYTNRKELPECKAVYFAISAKGEILYIGMTKNLRLRWLGHERAAECLEECKDIKIAWLEKPWRGFIRFEKAAISKYLPKANRVI